MTGEETYKQLTAFAAECRVFLDSQPGAGDLDASSRWLESLNALYGRWAQMNGLAKAAIAILFRETIAAIPADSEEWKKIKNSSTAQMNYVQGKFPKMVTACEDVSQLGYVLRSAADNTRTLISSFRLEREINSRTQVRQTASN